MAATNRVTQLLLDWREGRAEALDELIPLVYEELRILAHSYVRDEGPGRALQTTDLVHEAYLRLVNLEVDWRDRHHFFALAARQMRRILVDLARRRRSEKRGGDRVRIDLEGLQVAAEPAADLLALDDALNRLAQLDPRKSQILELRFFGGLTIRETAEAMELSDATVERDYKMAKAWLSRELLPDA